MAKVTNNFRGGLSRSDAKVGAATRNLESARAAVPPGSAAKGPAQREALRVIARQIVDGLSLGEICAQTIASLSTAAQAHLAPDLPKKKRDAHIRSIVRNAIREIRIRGYDLKDGPNEE